MSHHLVVQAVRVQVRVGSQLSFDLSLVLEFDSSGFAAGLGVSRDRQFLSSGTKNGQVAVVRIGMSRMNFAVVVMDAVAGEAGSHVAEVAAWGHNLMRRVLMGFVSRCLHDLVRQWVSVGKVDFVVGEEEPVAVEVAGWAGSCRKVQVPLVVAEHIRLAVDSAALACRSAADLVEALDRRSHMMALVVVARTHRRANDVAVAWTALEGLHSLVVL